MLDPVAACRQIQTGGVAHRAPVGRQLPAGNGHRGQRRIGAAEHHQVARSEANRLAEGQRQHLGARSTHHAGIHRHLGNHHRRHSVEHGGWPRIGHAPLCAVSGVVHHSGTVQVQGLNSDAIGIVEQGVGWQSELEHQGAHAAGTGDKHGIERFLAHHDLQHRLARDHHRLAGRQHHPNAVACIQVAAGAIGIGIQPLNPGHGDLRHAHIELHGQLVAVETDIGSRRRVEPDARLCAAALCEQQGVDQWVLGGRQSAELTSRHIELILQCRQICGLGSVVKTQLKGDTGTGLHHVGRAGDQHGKVAHRCAGAHHAQGDFAQIVDQIGVVVAGHFGDGLRQEVEGVEVVGVKTRVQASRHIDGQGIAQALQGRRHTICAALGISHRIHAREQSQGLTEGIAVVGGSLVAHDVGGLGVHSVTQTEQRSQNPVGLLDQSDVRQGAVLLTGLLCQANSQFAQGGDLRPLRRGCRGGIGVQHKLRTNVDEDVFRRARGFVHVGQAIAAVGVCHREGHHLPRIRCVDLQRITSILVGGGASDDTALRVFGLNQETCAGDPQRDGTRGDQGRGGGVIRLAVGT